MFVSNIRLALDCLHAHGYLLSAAQSTSRTCLQPTIFFGRTLPYWGMSVRKERCLRSFDVTPASKNPTPSEVRVCQILTIPLLLLMKNRTMV